jgi:hypothetical protein
MLHHQEFTVCLGMSCPPQCAKAFQRQTSFLIHDLCMSSSGPTKACRHTIPVFCAQHHEQLSTIGVTVNLLINRFARASLKYFTYSFKIVLGHHMVWRPIQLQDTSCIFQTPVATHNRAVNWCCLLQVHLIKFSSNTGIGFQVSQPQKAIY